MSARAQEFLFQSIKELLPPHVSLVEAVAAILNLSSDSAYRRIRGETALVLDEVNELCQHYKISLDHILNVTAGSTLFQNVRIDIHNYSYEDYLADLLKQLEYVNSFVHKEIFYLTKDVPLFHNFYFTPLIAFRYFFWMKTIIQKPEFTHRVFELNCLTPEIESLSRKITQAYALIPSVEIWNTECINAVISQIEFYKDSGYFASAADIKTVYDSLEDSILHLKKQVDYGCKFLPGESHELKKNNFRFFYNRVILADNTIVVVTDKSKTSFLNYNILNYIVTRDELFCNSCLSDIQNMMRRATLISQTGERYRNIFFGIVLKKIQERKKIL